MRCAVCYPESGGATLCDACRADPANRDWVDPGDDLGAADDAAGFTMTMSYAEVYADLYAEDFTESELRVLAALRAAVMPRVVPRIDAHGHRRGTYVRKRAVGEVKIRALAVASGVPKSTVQRILRRIKDKMRAVPQRR